MGHTTNGSWDDVTSLGRNEVVFEGRNKAYGAYYVRQRYNHALLMGLLFSLSLLVVGGGVPMIISKYFSNNLRELPKEINRIVKFTSYTPLVKAKVTPPKPTNIKPPPQSQHLIPIIVQKPDPKDSEKTNHDLEHLAVGLTTVPGTPTRDPVVPTVPTNPGPTGVASTDIFRVVQVMPKFPGDMSEFLSNNIDFPAEYREIGTQGTVYATFVVEPDGSVSNIKILRGIAGAEKLSANTIDGLQKMPKWQPGMQNGHAVRVQYTLPVNFKLN
jgi:protein TonB